MQTDLFYNTTNETNPVLSQYKAQAATQEEKVLEYYQRHKGATALQVAEILGMHESSCRRSVTNLTKKGFLVKTNIKIAGKYGKPNYIYEMRSIQPSSGEKP